MSLMTKVTVYFLEMLDKRELRPSSRSHPDAVGVDLRMRGRGEVDGVRTRADRRRATAPGHPRLRDEHAGGGADRGESSAWRAGVARDL